MEMELVLFVSRDRTNRVTVIVLKFSLFERKVLLF